MIIIMMNKYNMKQHTKQQKITHQHEEQNNHTEQHFENKPKQRTKTKTKLRPTKINELKQYPQQKNK